MTVTRLERRISRVEESRFGKSGELTMTARWYSSDDDPLPAVVRATVFSQSNHALVRREDFTDDEAFWSQVESQHLRIHNRPKSKGKRFDFRVHYEGKL